MQKVNINKSSSQATVTALIFC